MTPEQRALRDAYLAEMWPVVREESRLIRQEKRQADRAEQREIEERTINSLSTGCAEIGPLGLSETVEECA